MKSLSFSIVLWLLLTGVAEGEVFKTKSKYKTKARYFRRTEQRMLDEINHYFVVQSWKEIEGPNRSVYPSLPPRLSDRYFGGNLDRLIQSRRAGIR